MVSFKGFTPSINRKQPKIVDDKAINIFTYLITNKSFQGWVQDPNSTSDIFWKKWISEHPEHINDVKKAREFIERLRFREGKLTQSEMDDMLGNIISKEGGATALSGLRDSHKFGFSQRKQWVQVAAVLFMVFSAAFLINHFSTPLVEESPVEAVEWNTLKNPRGRKSKVTLPDGTLVNLNYDSELRFPKKFNQNVRRVELVGEAFFEVTHDDMLPFVVKTGDIETEVLGTSFNISSFEWNKETGISLVTGKVKVRNTIISGDEDEDIYLMPGEQLTYNKTSFEMAVHHFDMESTLAWKQGIILFKDAGLDEFVDKLEKWYGVNFQLHGKPKRAWNINGRYQNERLEDILLGLKFVYDIDYKIHGKNVTLKIK